MTSAPSFGVWLAGLPVSMPAGTALEFVAQAPLVPLPLAPARVAGLMQLRGQPLLVLDASRAQAVRAPDSRAVLVVGTMPNAAALLVDAPPQAVRGDAPLEPLHAGGADDSARALQACPFADALVGHRREPDAAGAGWYEVDPARLFGALVRD